MINVIFDTNVILDLSSKDKNTRHSDSRTVFEKIKKSEDYSCYISTSSLENIDFLKNKKMKEAFPAYTKPQRNLIVSNDLKNLLNDFKLAKTPAYTDLNYDSINNSLVIASAIAIDGKVITRDKGMLDKYQNIAVSPTQFLKQMDQHKKRRHHVDFANLGKQYFKIQPEIEKQIDEVINSTSFIMGSKVRELEEELQKFTNAKHAITCSNGTDALLLAMMAMDIQPGDEIITTPFTFIATSETIALMNAKPIFVDIEEDTYNIDATKIEAVITNKTKAIMPVSIYGQPPDIDAIQRIADQYHLKVILDGAQSFGSTYKGSTDSSLCDISTTSFFPAKPMGCYGDGGALFTNNDEYAEKIRMLRVHGQNKRYHHKYIGMGGRLDTLQAGILLAKLAHYSEEIIKRQELAGLYSSMLNSKYIKPVIKSGRTSVWAQYTVRVEKRDSIQQELKNIGIPTAVHYPMPLHLQECFLGLGYSKDAFPIARKISKEVMSLPMNAYFSIKEIESITKKINQFD